MSRREGYGSWVRVTIVKKTGEPLHWQAALRPWADPPAYYDGLKRGDLIEIGDVERSLSSPQGGSPEVATFSFTVFDRDGYWRALLRDDNTRALTSQDVEYLIASQKAHLLQLTPRQGFRGQIKTPRPAAGRRFEVYCESRIGTRLGPLDLDASVLKRVYGLDDFANLPRENDGKAVEFLWGELSDEGTVNADGEDVAQGMVNPTHCGPEFQGSTPGSPPTAPTYLPAPPAFTYEKFGSGGSTTWDYAGVAHVEGGGKTTLGTPVRITGLPADGAFSTSNGVILHCAQYPSAQMAQVTGMYIYVRKVIGGVAQEWNYLDAGGEIFNTAPNTPFSAGPNSNADDTGYEDNGDDHHHKGGPAPPTVNTAQITPGTPGIAASSSFYEWFNLLGHLGKITALYALDTTTPAGGERVYKKVAAADIGDDYSSGKPFLFGPSGTGVVRVINGHTYFGFWGKTGDPRVVAAMDGSALFRVNLCGWPEITDQSYLESVVQWRSITSRGGYEFGGWFHAGYGDLTSSATPPTSVTCVAAPGGTIDPTLAESGDFGVMVSAVDSLGQESSPYPFHTSVSFADTRGKWLDSFPHARVDGTKKLVVSWSGATGAVKYRVYVGAWYYGARWSWQFETTGTSLDITSITTADRCAFGPTIWIYTARAVLAGGLSAPATPEITVVTGGYARPRRMWIEPVAGATSYIFYRRGVIGGYQWQWSVPTSQMEAGYIYFEDDQFGTGSSPFNGEATVATNARIIDQAAYVYQDVFVQLGGGINGQGYQTGDRLPVQTFSSSPTVPVVQTSAFESVQQATIRSMGTVKGAIACVYLNSRDITWRSFIEGMNRTFGFDWGENHHGQVMISIMDDTVSPVSGLVLREFADIRTVDDAGEVRDDELQNVTPYQFDLHPIEGFYRSGLKHVRREESISQYRGEYGADRPIEMIYCRDPATAEWSATRQNFITAWNPSYVDVTCGWHKALNIDLGQVIRVQHRDLVSPDPISLYVRRVRVSQGRRSVSIMGRDRTSTAGLVWDALGDETDPDDPNVMSLGDEDDERPYPLGAARLT